MTEKEAKKVEEQIARAYRDGQIMGMLRAGFTVSQIAASLEMNPSTVRTAIKRHSAK